MIPGMIKAPATLAMLGGGQLGRFFVTAAHELGYKVIVLDPDGVRPGVSRHRRIQACHQHLHHRGLRADVL